MTGQRHQQGLLSIARISLSHIRSLFAHPTLYPSRHYAINSSLSLFVSQTWFRRVYESLTRRNISWTFIIRPSTSSTFSNITRCGIHSNLLYPFVKPDMSTLSTSEAPTMMGTSRSPSPEGSIPKMVRVSKLDPVTDFGARLAIARNLCPDEALLAPPSQATTPTAEGGLSLLPAETPLIRGAEAFRQRPVYGSVKGSYTSPYDSGGKAPGDKHLPSWSTTMEEFEAKYGSRSRRALQKTGSGGNAESDHAVSSAPAIEPKKVAPTVPEGVSIARALVLSSSQLLTLSRPKTAYSFVALLPLCVTNAPTRKTRIRQ
jgi:hypothetical protein